MDRMDGVSRKFCGRIEAGAPPCERRGAGAFFLYGVVLDQKEEGKRGLSNPIQTLNKFSSFLPSIVRFKKHCYLVVLDQLETAVVQLLGQEFGRG